MDALWRRAAPEQFTPAQLERLYRDLGADREAAGLLETYKNQAIDALRPLNHSSLKGLLRRVIGKIFNDLEIKGWCREFEVKNAAAEEVKLAA